jgi:uncharacterized protein (DUF488 family)
VRILTIGHSTRPLVEFLALLQAHGIRRVADVRRYPGSRRHPHFAREALHTALASEGIEYVHMPDLGGRRSAARDSPNTAWRSASFRAYADYMASETFQRALEPLIDWAAGNETVVMCAEAVPWRCHRQLIADALVARGIEVRHVMTPTSAKVHVLNADARISPDGTITYPAGGAEQADLWRG